MTCSNDCPPETLGLGQIRNVSASGGAYVSLRDARTAAPCGLRRGAWKPGGVDTFEGRLQGGSEWWSAAVGEAQDGGWVRDAVERQVMRDIKVATNPLHGGRPAPFTEDSGHVRIGRIANWAGVLRLAARAGGWVLQPVAGRRPPHSAGMAELLSGIYAVGEQGEIWMERFLRGELSPEDQLAMAERFMTGPGSVEDLDLFFYD